MKIALWALCRAGLRKYGYSIMGTITIESTVLVACGRPEVYAFCVDVQARSAVTGQEGVVLHVDNLVADRSWTETHQTRTETITCSYVVYPVADSTRLTVTAQYVPKGIGHMFSGVKEGAYRKQEAARLATLKKAVERDIRKARSS
ncbi:MULTISPECIES: hypothetical protein [unclassified Arthrobacter]|uniref:hypothetical protein n=1 Tax=Pseudarthrobacter sp. S6 TaxID=3418420 RepID=UPI003390F6CE